MRWGKVILAFQAIMTLIIGIVFLVQVFNIEYNYEEKVQDDFTASGIGTLIIQEKLEKYNEYKIKFFRASYVLIVISLMEIVIIWRLMETRKITSNDSEFDFSKNFNA